MNRIATQVADRAKIELDKVIDNGIKLEFPIGEIGK